MPTNPTDRARLRTRVAPLEADPGNCALVIQVFHAETGQAFTRVVPFPLGN